MLRSEHPSAAAHKPTNKHTPKLPTILIFLFSQQQTVFSNLCQSHFSSDLLLPLQLLLLALLILLLLLRFPLAASDTLHLSLPTLSSFASLLLLLSLSLSPSSRLVFYSARCGSSYTQCAPLCTAPNSSL